MAGENPIETSADVCAALGRLGLDASKLCKATTIHRRHGNRLYRITLGGASYILKVFGDADASREVRAYALLKEIGVPTLAAIATADDALLLEDLEVSYRFRLAAADDVAKPEVGAALAAWYRALHRAGSRLTADQVGPLLSRREIDDVTPTAILAVASRVGGPDHSRWMTLANNIDRVKDATKRLSQTLNYNDLHWTNLALSRVEEPITAVVFDFHLMGLGLRYSDCRNAASALGPDAAGAFWDEYGEIDPLERTLDDVTAPLYALVEALQRPKFPSWAEPSLKLAQTGGIHSRLERALEVL